MSKSIKLMIFTFAFILIWGKDNSNAQNNIKKTEHSNSVLVELSTSPEQDDLVYRKCETGIYLEKNSTIEISYPLIDGDIISIAIIECNNNQILKSVDYKKIHILSYTTEREGFYSVVAITKNQTDKKDIIDITSKAEIRADCKYINSAFRYLN